MLLDMGSPTVKPRTDSLAFWAAACAMLYFLLACTRVDAFVVHRSMGTVHSGKSAGSRRAGGLESQSQWIVTLAATDKQDAEAVTTIQQSVQTKISTSIGSEIAPAVPQQEESANEPTEEATPPPVEVNLWDASLAAFRTEDRFMDPSMVGYKRRNIITKDTTTTTTASTSNPQHVSESASVPPADTVDNNQPVATSNAETASTNWNPTAWHNVMDQSMVGYKPRTVIPQHGSTPPTVPHKLDSVDRFFSPEMLNPMRRPVRGIYSDEGVGYERGGASMGTGYGWYGSDTHTSPYPPMNSLSTSNGEEQSDDA